MILDQTSVIDEILVSMRNADVLTTTQRGVTRLTVTETVTDISTFNLQRTNVKNVLTIKLDTVLQTDYVVNYETGIITFTANKTGELEIVYDYGSDKIFSGYPRDDLTINSFPRIAVEYIDIQSNPGGFGNVNVNKHDVSVVVYSTNKKEIRDTVFKVRTWCVTNQNKLKQLRLIKPVMTGPILIAGEFTKFKDKVHKQNFDFAGLLSYEVNNS